MVYSVLGLDLSLTATGVAFKHGRTSLIRVKSKGPARLVAIRQALEATIARADVAVLEGYSYASKNQAHQAGELGGVIRALLYECGVPYAVVAPSTLKKFATGSGNGQKSDMLAAAIRQLGHEGSNDDNEVDALWLREMGLFRYSPKLARCSMTVKRREAIEVVDWPALAK